MGACVRIGFPLLCVSTLSRAEIPPPVIWNATYDGGEHGQCRAVACDLSGATYAAGFSVAHDNLRTAARLIKFDADGSLLWTRTFSSRGREVFCGVAVDGIGNVYAAGYSRSCSGCDSDFLAVKCDSDGNVLLAREFDGGGDDVAFGVAVDASGTIYVAGLSAALQRSSSSARVVSYDPSGDLTWNVTHDSAMARDIAVDPSGAVYVAGASRPGDASDFLTLRYNPDRSLDWAVTWDGGGVDYAVGLALNRQGNVCAAGYSHDGRQEGTQVISYDSRGAPVWMEEWKSDRPYDVASDRAGHLYVAGELSEMTLSGMRWDSRLVARNPTGEIVWDDVWDSGGRDWASAVALDAWGRICVAVASSEGCFRVIKRGVLPMSSTSSGDALLLFPNPASGDSVSVFIDLHEEVDQVQVEMTALDGGMCLTRTLGGLSIDNPCATVSGLLSYPAGQYAVRAMVSVASGARRQLGPARMVLSR